MRLKEFALTGLFFFGTIFVGSTLAQTSTPATRTDPVSASMPPLVANARRAASKWSAENPNGVAVAGYLPAQLEVPIETVEQVISRDFAANGVSNVVYFYQQMPGDGTAFSLHQNGYSYGPYRLGNVREAIPVVARQVQLDSSGSPAFTPRN